MRYKAARVLYKMGAEMRKFPCVVDTQQKRHALFGSMTSVIDIAKRFNDDEYDTKDYIWEDGDRAIYTDEA